MQIVANIIVVAAILYTSIRAYRLNLYMNKAINKTLTLKGKKYNDEDLINAFVAGHRNMNLYVALLLFSILVLFNIG